MNRRILLCCGLSAALVGFYALGGCDYSAPESFDTAINDSSRAELPRFDPASSLPKSGSAPTQRGREERAAILESVLTLIKRSALQPGGANFELAIKKLNHYFEGTSPSEYELESAPREYLSSQLPPKMVAALENRTWSLRDTRHIEDCMMYYGIANRVAGTGENLDRVRRVFDWVVRQVQLVPSGSLRSARLPHAYARPYDVLLRGMATEADGVWAERAWLFIALCRQLGIDVGLITYTKTSTLEPLIPKFGTSLEIEATLYGLRQGPKPPVVWICAALIGEQAYLFDARLGLEIPGPGGTGVATLEEAMTDPAILERMNLPGFLPYGTSRASLLASRTNIGILIDSGTGYFAPKMKLLERELAGKNRSMLYRDPADERDRFLHVLGARAGGVFLWSMPLEVETRLFLDQQFVLAIQSSLFLFRPEFPLLYARVRQLRGELDEAIEDYGKLRFAENAVLVTDKKTRIPPEVQDGLDVYATYFMVLAQLEKKNAAAQQDEKGEAVTKAMERAEDMFKQTLELAPEPGPNQPYYNMIRWGANANLGRIYASKKDVGRAVTYQTQRDPTPQYIGNMLRARELVWSNPMSGIVTLPPPPPAKPIVRRPAQPPAKARN